MTITIKNVKLSKATVSYLETILWAETVMLPVTEDELVDGCMDVDEDHELYGLEECTPLDDHFGFDDFTEESLRKAQADIDDWFEYLEENDLYDRAEERQGDDRIAHDFWLTRNGHGAGYWDGDYDDRDDDDDTLGRDLTDACKPYGSQHVWVDESGNLHLEDG